MSPDIYRWIGTALTLALCGAARFAYRPARTRRAWWVALFATELGHIWAAATLLLALLLAILAARAQTLLDAATAALCLAAGLAFIRPSWSAWRASRSLAADLSAILPTPPPRLWSWRRLLRPPFSAPELAPSQHLVNSLPLDFYPARGPLPAAGAPCLVMLHGGGWDSGERTQFADMHRWLAAQGVAVATPSYRLAPVHPWPAQREDTLAALDWLRAHAAELGIDPTRLILAGRSAGGQIAAAVAYGSRPPGVTAVAALYACHDLNYVWSIRSDSDALNSDRLLRQFLGGGPEGRENLYRSASAEKLVHADAPPTLLIHGELDELVWCRHSERLAAALQAAGAPCVFLKLPWATHAADAHLHGPSGQLVSNALRHFCLSALPAPIRSSGPHASATTATRASRHPAPNVSGPSRVFG